jgi:glycosyltransferase involved in cell wall biosynthesis
MEAAKATDGRLKVVTLVDGLGLAGGGERLAREIVTRLDPDRFDRTLCVSRWRPEIAVQPGGREALAGLREAGVAFLGLERRSALDLPAWGPLLSLLRRGRVDVLHAHKFGSNVWAAMLRPFARTPVVIAHEHTWSFEGQPVRKLLDRRLIAARADAFLVVSNADRRRMIEVERIDPAKVVLVRNGIPPPPPPTNRDVRKELAIDEAAPVIGTVCALRPQKALDVLVDAAAILAPQVRGLRVVIAGEGPERVALERQIAALGLEGTVTLLGQRADVPDLLEALDVAVCSSDFEGTPLSILEYMDAALPVVATRVGGVPDVIESGTHGVLVEPRDPRSLAAAAGELLANRDRAAAMGRRGRERRRSEFDIERTVRHVERIYSDLSRGVAPAEITAAS